MTTKVSDGLRLVSHDDDQFALRRAFGRFPTGVSVHAAEIDGIEHALVASSFMVGVSLDPPLVAVAVQENSETWPLLRDAERFGVSVFAAGQGPLVRQLAGKDRAARFDDVAVEHGEHGPVPHGGIELVRGLVARGVPGGRSPHGPAQGAPGGDGGRTRSARVARFGVP
ncbi:hypothetical protein HNR16_001877 [Pseudoclavibacter chungangensis]|nr:flavin reductase family protein [Pseudoclavibacter chungangensis]NYJ67089.1 hypothetical protein [Pseudoclavibacter chungangensis]